MGLWRTKEKDAATTGENGLGQAVEDLQARVADLERERDEWAEEIRRHEIEWQSMYEKFRALYGRIEKRAKRDGEAAQLEMATPPINPLAAAILHGTHRGEDQ